MSEFESPGENPIKLSRLHKLPYDAKVTLLIRDVVTKQLKEQGGMGTPVDDLLIEESRSDLTRLRSFISNPLVLSFPRGLLRMLARLG